MAIAFLVGLIVPALAFGGTTGKISGVVKDVDTGDMIPGVSIIVEGMNLGAVSDVDGYYFILNIPPGEYSVSAAMMGYVKSTMENVLVNADRTTEVSFSLKATVLEVSEALIVMAERPLVEPDLAASQTIVTPEETEALPANQVLEALFYEPGVDLANLSELRIRGDTPDEISFQVDGLERTDPLNNRAYTVLNSAMIQEIQIITGGFNAEYGNLRAGLINVIEKETARKLSYTLDFRYVPAQQKHFGPNAYGDDQYDHLLYGRDNASYDGMGIFWNDAGESKYNPYDQVWDKPLEFRTSTDRPVWVGWNNRAAQIGTWRTKSDWTAKELQEVWLWRHRGWDYAEDPDIYLDSGVGIPLSFLKSIGLRNAGIYAGYKYNKVYLPVAAVVPAATDRSFEIKFTANPTSSIKLTLSGMYGDFEGTSQGNQWSSGVSGIGIYGGNVDAWRTLADTDMLAYYSGNSEWGGNKYNIYHHTVFDQTFKGGGLKLTHTLSPSSFYELRYSWFRQDQEAKRGKRRMQYDPNVAANPALAAVQPWLVDEDNIVKRIGGVGFDETPDGWQASRLGELDLTGTYELGGGGMVHDDSYAETHRLNLDFTSQLSPRHMIKTGLDLNFADLFRNYARMNVDVWLNNHFNHYDVSPRQYSFYVQDKIEYSGMIANLGLRVEHYKSGGKIFDPDDPYSVIWSRGGSSYSALQATFPDIDFPEYPPPELADMPLYLPPELPPDLFPASIPSDLSDLGDETLYLTLSEISYWLALDPSDTSAVRSILTTLRNNQYMRSHGSEIAEEYLSLIPSRDGESYTVWSPRIGISHPIGEATKFFFSYGKFFNAPMTQTRYGVSGETWDFGDSGCEVRLLGNPDMKPPVTTAYEVGFERSIRDQYLVRVRGYVKDESEQVAQVTYTAEGGSPFADASYGRTQYITYDNSETANYEDIRGLEAKVTKLRGRWVTGWVTFDYRIQSSGNIGYLQIFSNPLEQDRVFAAYESQPEPAPSFFAGITLHTPPDFGQFLGGFHLTFLQRWQRGTKYIWNPDQLPISEIEDKKENILHWADTFNTDLRLTKGFNLGGQNIGLYVDIKNLFDTKVLNTSAITDWTRYIEKVVIAKDMKIGAKDTFKYLEKGWIDDEGNWNPALALKSDWFRYRNSPRSFLLGIRISY